MRANSVVSQQFQHYPEDDLRAARDRLNDTLIDGQETWILGKLYDLTIEIGTFCGQVSIPAGTPPQESERLISERRSLTHFLREQAACDEARRALEKLDLQGPPDDVHTEIRALVQRATEAYREALRAARLIHDDNPDHVIHDAGGVALPFEGQMSLWEQQLAGIREANRNVGLLDHLAKTQAGLIDGAKEASKAAKEVSTELEVRRASLNDLRAQEASRNLSTHFASLASSERWKGALLRALSIVSLVGAMAIAWTAGVSKDSLDSWTLLSRHLAITLLLAGGAAYVAKLASSHYTFGQWARSIQVQLDSFEGFIGVVEDQGARDRMREEFGRRVLGAPPQATDDGSTGLTTGELLQLLASTRPPSSAGAKGA